MLRCALVLTVAATVLCSDDAALAARATTTVAGDVRAVAFTGDALAVAYLPARGGLAVERFAGGAPAQPLLSTSLRNEDDAVQLAGSAQALAVSLQPDAQESFGPSSVIVGPAAGPLREVSVCQAGLLPPPVAVIGARIAWRDGACGDPAGSPNAITPPALVLGAADPAFPPTRIALDATELPASIVLDGDDGLVGALRPSFFAADSEVRAFGPGGLGAALVTQRSSIVSPVGVLTDGTRVFSLANLDVGESDHGGVCPNSLFTIAPGASERRGLSTGGCPLGAEVPTSPVAARAGADRAYALAGDTANRSGDDPPRISVVSLRGDGGDRRVHAFGTYRPPLGIAADGDRVAYWHRRCSDARTDVVVVDRAGQDGGPAEIASCRARVLTRSARVRNGAISVSLRCPAGCRGTALDASVEPARRLRSFALRPGTRALRLKLPSAVRRRGRLRLELAVENGPARLGVIRLRR